MGAKPSGRAGVRSVFVERLMRAVAAAPASVALSSATGTMTFGALGEAMRRAAWRVATAVPVGQAVATLVPHDPPGAAALLGCLASGRVTVPLSPGEPPERRAAILAAAGPATVLDVTGGPREDGRAGLALADVLADGTVPEGFPAPLPADAPAIVHFTSGSSGTPKGVAFALDDMLHRCDDGMPFRPDDRALATSLPATSSGLCFVVGPLLDGARVLLANLAVEGAGTLLRLMREEGATCLSAGPALVRLLAGLPSARTAFAGLRLVRSGGAAMSGADVRALRAVLPAGCAVVHRYASTEGGLVAAFPVPPDHDDDGPLPAGWPLPSVHLSLDGVADPASGEAGELVLRGAHIARGDWREGRLSEKRIAADPERPGWRVYRTGDLFRFDAAGRLCFAGRADRQVKINGMRIEPGEVEHALRSCAGVRDAAVVTIGTPTSVLLHGFVQSEEDPEALRARLRAHLAASLPSAMRPARLTVLTGLPHLENGKPDMAELRRRAQEAT